MRDLLRGFGFGFPVRFAAVAAVVLTGMAVPVSGERPALAMLDRLEHGRWDLRTRSPGVDLQSICLSNGRGLIQLRHPGDDCPRLIIDDSENEVTVQYTCKGRGYGRTHIRRETDRLVQIETQGIDDGLPFSFVAEGRRIGDCGD
jgi:hypothetical protein